MNVYARLSENEKSSLNKAFPGLDISKLDINRLWNLMDQIWDDLGCNYSTSEDNLKKIEKFYEHPVWILNGLFVEKDSESQINREKIVNWINKNNKEYLVKSVLDYGGGFGTLGRMIVDGNQKLKVDIYEPHPLKVAEKIINKYKQIKFVDNTSKKYDAVVCTDVLEHVFKPLDMLEEIKKTLKTDGIFIVGSCFYPFIKCHLPKNFYLRYFFKYFAYLYNFELVKQIPGGYLYVFRNKAGIKNIIWIKISEVLARLLYRPLNFTQFFR